jgi:hypothetical protein
MKRVYLDQKDWINLSRANQGLPSGAKFADALLVARAGVAQGLTSFPLSLIHYMETYHRNDWKSRFDVADVMAELSHFHTIASPTGVVPAEIDRALQARFGRPVKPRPLQVFGHGLRHAANDESFQFSIPGDLPIGQETRIEFERDIADDWERAMLRGPAVNMPLAWLDTHAHRQVEKTYQQNEQALTQKLKQTGWGKGDELRRFMLASGLIDILDPLLEALERAQISLVEFLDLDRDGATAFLQDVSSRWVLFEMRRDLHARGVHEEGDIRDLAALSVAVAYSDVAVTEKQWVHVLTMAKVDQMMQTTLLSNVAELPQAIV